MLGRVLDAVCTDKEIASQANGRPIFLKARLANLVTQENLTKIDGATGLRNVAAHADLGGLLLEDVQYLEALIRYVLDHLYVIPAVKPEGNRYPKRLEEKVVRHESVQSCKVVCLTYSEQRAKVILCLSWSSERAQLR